MEKISELTYMEIYMNNFYRCTSNGQKYNNCTSTGCSVDLPYSDNPDESLTEVDTPGNIALPTVDSFDFRNWNITMTLRCMGEDEVSYMNTFGVVFKRRQRLSSFPIDVSQLTSHRTYGTGSTKDTSATTTQTGASDNTKREKQAKHKWFFDDPINVALVSAVSVIAVFGSMTVMLYCLLRRQCKSMTVLPGRTGRDEEESTNEAPTEVSA